MVDSTTARAEQNALVPCGVDRRTASSAIARIEKLRQLRVVPRRDVNIAGEVDAQLREAKKTQKATKAIDERWRVALPAELVDVLRTEKISRGVLTLIASDASAKYACERWLREGGVLALQAVTPAIKRVVVRL
jgi:hypothetical protein